MDAKEAERTEVEIRELDERISYLKRGLEGENNLKHILEGKEIILFDYENHKKSLSIVLESAKLFHQHTVPDLIRDNVRFGRSEEYKTVYGVPLEKVGIELDKEEEVAE